MELLEEILDRENLNKAYKHVKANKGAPGVDGVTIDEAYNYIAQNKEKLLQQIRKRRYKPKPHLKSYQKLIRKLKALTKRSWSISLDNRIKQINYLVRGWVNYFRIANMRDKMRKIDKHLRTRIRVIIWKQWKNITRKEKALIQLGIERRLAHNIASTRKGYQFIAQMRWIVFAINNERLRKRGLIFLSDQYSKVHIEI